MVSGRGAWTRSLTDGGHPSRREERPCGGGAHAVRVRRSVWKGEGQRIAGTTDGLQLRGSVFRQAPVADGSGMAPHGPPGLTGALGIMMLQGSPQQVQRPCLLSGLLRLPHLGDCTQEGQPSEQLQASIASAVARTHSAASSNPLREACTPGVRRRRRCSAAPCRRAGQWRPRRCPTDQSWTAAAADRSWRARRRAATPAHAPRSPRLLCSVVSGAVSHIA